MAPKRDLQNLYQSMVTKKPKTDAILAKINVNNTKLLAYDCIGKSLSSNNLPTCLGTEKSPIRMVDNGMNCVFLSYCVY